MNERERGKAKLIRVCDKSEGWTGEARLYELDPPVEYHYWDFTNVTPDNVDCFRKFGKTCFVIVSAIRTKDMREEETFIFPCSDGGKVLNWKELKGSIKGELNIEKAIINAGYDIV